MDHNLQRVPGRYRLHDLIRLHARDLADRDPAPARDAALDRLMDYYQHTAARADVLISPIPRLAPAGPGAAYAPALPDADTSRVWLRTERPNLLAALRYATSHARPERAITLTAGLATLLRDDGPWPEALTLHTDAAAARTVADCPGQAAALTQLGIIRYLTGDGPGALDDLEQAAQLYRELGDSLGQANAPTQLGDIRGFVDDWPGAVDDLEQALRLYQQLGNRLGQANALARLGNIRRYTGDYPGAIPQLEEALRLYQRLGDRNGQGKMLISLGNAQRVTGDFAGAARSLEEALRLNGHLDHQLGRANSLSELGELQRLTGDLPAAARYLEQGLQIFQDLGNRMGQANAQVWLGSVRQATGDLAGASQLLEAAMDTFRPIGSRGSEAWALNRYAAMISATGDSARAEALYLGALRLARETRQLDDEAFALEGSGEHLLRRSDTRAGITHLQQALEIFQRMAMQPDADRVQARLARVNNPQSPAGPIELPSKVESASPLPPLASQLVTLDRTSPVPGTVSDQHASSGIRRKLGRCLPTSPGGGLVSPVRARLPESRAQIRALDRMARLVATHGSLMFHSNRKRGIPGSFMEICRESPAMIHARPRRGRLEYRPVG